MPAVVAGRHISDGLTPAFAEVCACHRLGHGDPVCLWQGMAIKLRLLFHVQGRQSCRR